MSPHHAPATPHADPAAFLRHLFDVAVRRADPALVLPPHLPEPPSGAGRTVVIGAGKASGAMARAVEAAWPGDKPLSGVVLTRYGHVPPPKRSTDSEASPTLQSRIDIIEAGHPIPDEAGLHGTARLLAALEGLTEHDLVIALISGGGSSLLTAPAAGMTLQAEQALHRQLLRCGAPIGELNTVRRHLSLIKGGRLAARCGPAHLVTLAISDVPGDRLEDIASGPTVSDPSTCADALDIIERYRIDLPEPALAALRAGSLETHKPGDPVFGRHKATLIATPHDMLQAAAEAARQAGIRAHILSDRMEGEAREVGRVHAALAAHVRSHGQPFEAPCILLSGGETTVTMSPASGSDNTAASSGGRNTELLLAAALALKGQPAVWMLAADTDGIDGQSDAAGALMGPDTLARAAQLGLDARAMLQAHNSGAFFDALNDSILTGPTYTNVNDFRAAWIG